MKTKIKRTAKWHKPLTIAELRHLNEHIKPCTLREFKAVRDYQREQCKRYNIMLIDTCWICYTIERKLIDANVLKKVQS